MITCAINGDSDDRIGRGLSGVDLFTEEVVRLAVLATSFDLSSVFSFVRRAAIVPTWIKLGKVL